MNRRRFIFYSTGSLIILSRPGLVMSQVLKAGENVTIFLCGDVMTGRGIDQVLPFPSDPQLHEPYVRDARRYVEIAEELNGPISKPVDFSYIWGDALEELRRADVRIINLETSITTSNDYERGKGINYRMHPKNIPCISVANIDCCVLANNHVMDWGYPGLAETLKALGNAGIETAGAGNNLAEAQSPAILQVSGKGRVLVFAFGLESSGIPRNWAAKYNRSGVNLLRDLSTKSVKRIHRHVSAVKQPGDVVVASIHWGGNWGYSISDEQRQFARQLVDSAQVDVIHGHSSHHVKGFEVYKNKLIIYGCGDFLNDYEGIQGYEHYRADLALMYFVRVMPATGELVNLEMVPMQVKRFRSNRASAEDVLWLRQLLNREGKNLNTRVEVTAQNNLLLQQ